MHCFLQRGVLSKFIPYVPSVSKIASNIHIVTISVFILYLDLQGLLLVKTEDHENLSANPLLLFWF